jgi:hypothetical protein
MIDEEIDCAAQREARYAVLTVFRELCAEDNHLHPTRHAPDYAAMASPKVVTMRAYEVYRHLYGEQQALVEGSCRGGFGANELIAFLYAATFPKAEWRQRVDEALTGMEGI